MNDKAFLLSEYEMFDEAIEVIERALEYDVNPLLRSYLQLNYAKICVSLQRADDCVKIYQDIITTIEEIHKDSESTNETIKLLAFANFNLAVHYQDLIATPDNDKAAKYLHRAIKIFESRVVPTPEFDYYHSYAIKRLKLIDENGLK